MIKHRFRSATVTCTVLNTTNGDTKELTFTIPHPIKVFNDRTKTRVLKEIERDHMGSTAKEFKPIFAKTYENTEIVVTMTEEDFLKYGKIVADTPKVAYADTDSVQGDLSE